MAIIKNYGFLWERKYLDRGKGGNGNAGSLWGYQKRKHSIEVDFKKQIGVYVLYDKDQNIVYVGQAGNGNATLFGRLKAHEKDDLWNRWEYFSWVGFKDITKNCELDNRQKVSSYVRTVKYSNALNEIEGILIEFIEPKLNKQSGKLTKATEYLQYVDDSMKESNADLMNEIRNLKKQIEKL